MPASETSPDFQKLADYLEALANPGRLALLHQLRQPKTVGDIQIAPTDPGDGSPARNISRQAVRKQLEKLERAGLVVAQQTRRNGTKMDEHMVNHAMLFAVTEELRRVTRLAPTVPLAPAATMTGSRLSARQAGSVGAHVIMVHGPKEGHSFMLQGTPGETEGWVIGRRRHLPISLDHDPFVSGEHAKILQSGDSYEILDLQTNKNGTDLNWDPLPRGGKRRLRHGDIIGIGRTLLLFREG
jgi:DNA-binding transcriptional ArsR family regulator